MNIIVECQLEFKSVPYIGKCKRCGCKFITDIQQAKGLNGGNVFKPTDYLKNLDIKDPDGTPVFVCDCPQCGMPHTKLRIVK